MDRIQAKARIRNPLGRALLGEFLGTALLVLAIGCVCAQAIIPRPALNQTIGVNLGVGLGIAFGVAICAKVSAVSLMFLTFKQLTPVRFALYSLVQTAGAFVGAALTYAVYCDAINAFDGGTRQVFGPKATAGIFASYSGAHVGVFNGLLDQIVATALFCLLIAHITDKRSGYPVAAQPWLVGLAFVLVGTGFAYNAGYPCNPARDFGPRLFTLLAGYGWEVFSYKDYGWFWIPIVGPLIGGALGGWLYQFAIGIHIPTDEAYDETAQGAKPEHEPLAGASTKKGEP